MKPILIASGLVLLLAAPVVHAQAPKPVYRCDNNHYTQTPKEDARAHNCKVLEGGNVTIVEGTRPQNQATTAPGTPVRVANAPASASQPSQRIDAGDQRARDSDARVILESELKKAESRRQELAQEYNNGEPEKRGEETRNHQKYLDRVADLKTSLQRIDNDIAGIRRELGRANASNGAAGGSIIK
jgi:hypothetical protein